VSNVYIYDIFLVYQAHSLRLSLLEVTWVSVFQSPTHFWPCLVHPPFVSLSPVNQLFQPLYNTVSNHGLFKGQSLRVWKESHKYNIWYENVYPGCFVLLVNHLVSSATFHPTWLCKLHLQVTVLLIWSDNNLLAFFGTFASKNEHNQYKIFECLQLVRWTKFVDFGYFSASPSNAFALNC